MDLSRGFVALLLLASLPGESALAQTDSGYTDRLKAMSEHLRSERAKALKLPAAGDAQTPGAALSLGLKRKFLEPGQSWRVDVYRKSLVAMRRTGEPKDLREKALPVETYYFQVAALTEGRKARVEIRPENERKPKLALTLDDRFVILSKEELDDQGRVMRFTALPENHNTVMGFEAFPIVLPDLSSTAGEPLESVPAKLRETRPRFDRERAARFQFADMLGRRVEVIWQDGDPWPSFVETAGVVAVMNVVSP